ncbi:MAG: hypothetical protein MRY74_12255 [Neomegalonema sp.]|nr:hypothetical protein [Neomegalonema sp.]
MADRITNALGYVFGRNILIGVAAIMLLLISGYATWHGMSDFILGFQTQGQIGAPSQRGIAGLSVTTEALIIAIVVALTFLMWLSLRETFGARRPLRDRLVSLPLYLFLALWSVGFGYGFWWSLIAGPSATQEGLRTQVEEARTVAKKVEARLKAVSGSLIFAVDISNRRMAQEETSGGSCGVPSGTGRGPLYRARSAVRDSVSALQAGIERTWLTPVRGNVERLEKEAAALVDGLKGATVAERSATFRKSATEIRRNISEIATTSNEQGRSYAARLRQLAKDLEIKPGQPGFTCFDAALAEALRSAADQAQEQISFSLPPAEFNEGAAGVAKAVLALWDNLGRYFFAIFDYWSQDDKKTADAKVAETEGGDPITGRDLIALLAALGIDLGLFALTVMNPPAAPALRPDTAAELRMAIADLRKRANVDDEWIKSHFVFHVARNYLVVPNVYSCLGRDIVEKAHAKEILEWAESDADPGDEAAVTKARQKLLEDIHEDEGLKGRALNTFVAKLHDLKLIRAPGSLAMWMARREERRWSRSNVEDKVRNHALLSKARHQLKHMRWSQQARKDLEVYELIDIEGFIPFMKAFQPSEGPKESSAKV